MPESGEALLPRAFLSYLQAATAKSLLKWLGELDEDRTFASVVTLAELGDAIERLGFGTHRERLTVSQDTPNLARFRVQTARVDCPAGYRGWAAPLALAEGSCDASAGVLSGFGHKQCGVIWFDAVHPEASRLFTMGSTPQACGKTVGSRISST